MYPEFSVGDIGKAAGGNAVLAPSPSVRLLLRYSFLLRFLVGVGVWSRRAATDAQVFVGDAVVAPELFVGGE